MIAFTETEIESERERKLRIMFTQPEFKLLLQIVESKGKKALINSTSKALESKYYPSKADSANSDLLDAIRYKDFLEIIAELRDSSERFRLLTIK